MWRVESVQDVQDMARGAVLLGTGGGGDPYIGELFLRAQMQRGKFATIVDPADVDDDAFILSIFHIGAPPPDSESLVIGHEALGEVEAVGSGVSNAAVGDLDLPGLL